MRELVSAVGSALATYQPSQRYLVLDERHVARDDLSGDNSMAAVAGLEQSRSPASTPASKHSRQMQEAAKGW